MQLLYLQKQQLPISYLIIDLFFLHLAQIPMHQRPKMPTERGAMTTLTSRLTTVSFKLTRVVMF